MNLSEVNGIAETLGQYIKDRGIIGDPGEFGALYVNGEKPSSKLPESFLEITGNGPLTSGVTQNGLSEYNLLATVNVKLTSRGVVNTKRETFLLSILELWLKGTVKIDKYHYTVNKNQMVYSGKDLISGYSSKVININVKIY